MCAEAVFTIAKRWKRNLAFDKWMAKPSVEHPYNGILFSHKDEQPRRQAPFGCISKASCCGKESILEMDAWFRLGDVVKRTKLQQRVDQGWPGCRVRLWWMVSSCLSWRMRLFSLLMAVVVTRTYPCVKSHRNEHGWRKVGFTVRLFTYLGR